MTLVTILTPLHGVRDNICLCNFKKFLILVTLKIKDQYKKAIYETRLKLLPGDDI